MPKWQRHSWALQAHAAGAKKGLEIAKSAKVKTILNPAPATKLPDGFLTLCDFITPNETETETLTGVKVSTLDDAKIACEKFKEMGVETPIITLGEKGAYLHEHGLIQSYKVGQVLETTGAGDAFNGGFAAALSEGRSTLESINFGCATAGISVTRAGTAPSMPTRDEVEKIL